MKHYFRLLKYLIPYKSKVILSIVFNILTVFFSLGSIAIIIPVLKIIFKNIKVIPEKPIYNHDFKAYAEQLLNYYISFYSNLNGPFYVLLWVVAIAGILFLCKNVLRYFAEILLVNIKNAVERDIRNDLHRKILDMPLSQLTEQRKGDLMARLTNDILEIQWAIFSSIQRLIQDPLMIILTVIVLIFFSAKLTIFVIILIPITGIVITSLGNSLKKPSEKAKEELGKIMSHIEENIGALSAIRSYVGEKRVQKKFEDSNQQYFNAMNQMLYKRELSSPVSEVMGTLVMLAIITYGSYLIINYKELEPEVFITYITLFYQIINPAKSLSVAIYDIKRGEASSSRIFSLLDAPNPLKDKENALSIIEFNQSIEFENVNFSYIAEKIAVENFNLTINKGETVALVGQSGSGKSTIAALLNRFYDVDSGSIKIDGKDLRDLKQHDFRKLIAYIPQEAHLFNDTIKENLLLGNPNATMDDIINACKIANAYDFILLTENGFDTVIGDRGSKLSGGQRQRLTIARAVLKNPPILLLDEATSALDAESEKLVQDALNKLLTNRTSIVIAHRFSTIKNADKIIVMKDGKIIEVGNHDSLVKAEGEYFKLVQLQGLE